MSTEPKDANIAAADMATFTIDANIIEAINGDFLSKVLKINLQGGPTDPLDYISARKWLETDYRPLPKTPLPTKTARETVSVDIQNVTVTYNETESFNVRVYQPQTNGLRPAILAYHGGGWIHGYSELEDDALSFLASETRAVIFGVDYRLAPEYPFPVPHNDSYEALNFVTKNSAAYNVDPARIGLWGCSAGGNLAASVALRDAQEHETTRICHASLLVPAVCPPSEQPPALQVPTASFPFFNAQTTNPFILQRGQDLWEVYAGDKKNLSHKYFAPLLAAPPANHCPLHIVVAGVDVLRDEGIAYAMQYRDAGIDTQLEIVPGAPHGLLVANTAWVSRQFWTNQVRVLNAALHTSF
ncbi:hypothetical protein SEUCBS140593_009531 [Sporothrix eucalyptigena]|uniref:Alpha/beta hydrolase fold-3 domain-containing protein n=1 Tax=Sporothrix eucalyptigena TaxID=1812306 RepID=A0ABP0CX85_9PEZI